jgi:carbamoyltransferase
MSYGVDHIAYYERPWAKQMRQMYSGQGIDWNQLTVKQILKSQLGFDFTGTVSAHNHHLCHAAAGFQTSKFNQATVVVIDAIGEWDTVSIWAAEYDSNGQAVYRRLYRQVYPHSVGLFYSAVTERIGLKPMDEEYITMGMAAWGNSVYANEMQGKLISDCWRIKFWDNLHTGLPSDFLPGAPREDLAAAAQKVAEKLINSIMQRAKNFRFSENLVYMGGVALNCLANRNLGEYFEKIWIMPAPGDAGSSIGAAAVKLGLPIDFTDAFLGHLIPGDYPVGACVDHLVHNNIVGVASGRSEFGPRALGNRSLLADPRGKNIKDLVNDIKRRQKFRPFAPVILAEMVDQYFDMPRGWSHSDYMQVVARCRYPELYPAVCHVDGTSRVQTVAPDSNSGIRKLLEAWYQRTGCPMLLNTSLNVRGEPMVNDRSDADRFEKLYGITVLS